MKVQMTRALGGFVCVCLAASTLTACQNTAANAPVPSAEATPAPTPEPTPPPQIQFGDEIASNDIRIVPLDARIVAELWPTYPDTVALFLKPEAGQAFLTLDADIFNDTEADISLQGRLSVKISADDAAHPASIALEDADMDSIASSRQPSIAPGQSRAHFVVALPLDALADPAKLEALIALDKEGSRIDLLEAMKDLASMELGTPQDVSTGFCATTVVDAAFVDQIQPLHLDKTALAVDIMKAKEGQILVHVLVRADNTGADTFDAMRAVRCALVDADGIEHQMQVLGDKGNGRNFEKYELPIETGQSADLHFIFPIDAAQAERYTGLFVRVGTEKRAYLTLPAPAPAPDAAPSPEPTP